MPEHALAHNGVARTLFTACLTYVRLRADSSRVRGWRVRDGGLFGALFEELPSFVVGGKATGILDQRSAQNNTTS